MKCEICGNEFRGRFKQKYCSDKCRNEVWRRYLKQRYSLKREKMIEEHNRRLELWKKNGSWHAVSLTEEPSKLVLEKLIDLAKKQQYSNILKRDNKCCACSSTDRQLVLHHVKYSPIITVTLCKQCHEYLHKHLLAKQRVAPRVI